MIFIGTQFCNLHREANGLHLRQRVTDPRQSAELERSPPHRQQALVMPPLPSPAPGPDPKRTPPRRRLTIGSSAEVWGGGGRANRIHPHPEGLVFLSWPRVGMTTMCYHRPVGLITRLYVSCDRNTFVRIKRILQPTSLFTQLVPRRGNEF